MACSSFSAPVVESRRKNGLQWRAIAILWMILLSCIALSAGSFVGMNLHSHLSSPVDPKHFVDLVSNLGVRNVRLHNANASILKAFAHSDVEILVGITNDLIPALALSQVSANFWVKNNVLVYLPKVKIRGMVVGNEVLTGFTSASAALLPAMQNLHKALIEAKLEKQIKVSTSHSSSIILSEYSYPSQAYFRACFSALIKPILDFLHETESYFMLSINPMVWYKQSIHNASLDYALFTPNHGVIDPTGNVVYQNLFDAVIDAAFNAMAAMNHPQLPIVVSETGWPWEGSPAEDASPENAAIYNQNLVKHVLSNSGTPQKPDAEINTYIFYPFDGLPSQDRWSWIGSNAPMHLNYRELVGFSGRDSVNGSAINGQSWCVAQSGVPDSQLAVALNWACGPQGNADCAPIQQNGPCFNPDTYSSHSSYAFNSFYQMNGQTPGSCDFGGAAMIVNTDPSYSGCSYPPSGGSGSSNFNPNGTNDPSFAVAMHVSSIFIASLLCILILAYLRL